MDKETDSIHQIVFFQDLLFLNITTTSQTRDNEYNST